MPLIMDDKESKGSEETGNKSQSSSSKSKENEFVDSESLTYSLKELTNEIS